jgi:ADP-ribose pyrophosphatase YjhB (NUDIX family)
MALIIAPNRHPAQNLANLQQECPPHACNVQFDGSSSITGSRLSGVEAIGSERWYPVRPMQRPQWLNWACRLQAIAQNGLTFAGDPFDIERYQAIRRIAAEMLAEGSGEDAGRILNLFSQEVGYATPKVDVRGVVFKDGRILLVQERSDGGWTLPGGWVDVGDSPSEAVVREVREESGYETRAVKLLALIDRNQHGYPPHPDHIYKLFFLCEITGGAAAPSLETQQVGFFDEHALPPLSLTRIMPQQIARLFEHDRHPEWAADFD